RGQDRSRSRAGPASTRLPALPTNLDSACAGFRCDLGAVTRPARPSNALAGSGRTALRAVLRSASQAAYGHPFDTYPPVSRPCEVGWLTRKPLPAAEHRRAANRRTPPARTGSPDRSTAAPPGAIPTEASRRDQVLPGPT